MNLKLVRTFKGPKYTIGKLYIDGEYFCDTLEDVVRVLNSISDKIYGETAIPAGEYQLVLSMSNRFKRILPAILNVPFFEGIRIHAGNTDIDSHGCILVGENKEKGKVINSKKYEVRLVEILSTASDKITIEII
jgi:hypothetical protein